MAELFKNWTADAAPPRTPAPTNPADYAGKHPRARDTSTGVAGDTVTAAHFDEIVGMLRALATEAMLTLANYDTDAKRYDLLKDAIVAITGRTASNLPVGLFSGVDNTPALSDDGTGKYLAKDGTTENVVLRDLPSANVVIGTAAPTTANDDSGGKVWFFGGHTFLYRGLVGTEHVWDVAGVWATAVTNQQGNTTKNGIYAPPGYAGDGWARFTDVRRVRQGEYRYTMRNATAADNYVVNPTADQGQTPNATRAFDDAESVGTWNHTANAFSVTIGQDTGDTPQDAGHRVVVTRTGTV